MRRAVLAATLMATMLPGPAAYGGTIERACMKADRPNATRRLCSCIQDVANATLSGGERSKVAKFFKDPHKSQATRQSDRRTDEKFWLKYKQFGDIVTRHCG
ncbi:hypothetical protein SAMN04488030_0248 [Aliiroseovarius halocynthiae]|uniref:Arginine transporter n=2 Tax=Aliiroseovarius halocynthiae TaxID=985055 RepID=A0A545SYD5_9RHOB|nr:hypothetical protein [Aliiroseovarius halocynthiae]TQV69972.1 hypothetical protein FIL88_00950 [Aliiroseovarius halocynthiae]SMR70636.1 hypothetical protein SAMN04488030_0248 [Aliiroseovarius halocynthiae]